MVYISGGRYMLNKNSNQVPKKGILKDSLFSTNIYLILYSNFSPFDFIITLKVFVVSFCTSIGTSDKK